VKKYFFIIVVISILSLTFADHTEARARYGSIRIGGYTSHGKGSHYIGGYVRHTPIIHHKILKI
jgi:hypothetical protein